MFHTRTLGGVMLALAGLLALAGGTASAQELYRNEMASSAGWALNASSGDTSATFGYDYSSDDIPEAPNSVGGDAATRGVKLQANLNDPGTLEVFTLYPLGQSFSGDYRLRFDAWMNHDADERINGGSNGTTEFIGGGVGYDNTAVDVLSGAQLLATGDGGSGSDWRAFKDGFFVAADDMAAHDRNGFNPYYSDFLPGVSPPAGQLQVDFPAGTAGSPGFQWITVEFEVHEPFVNVFIEKPGGERLLILHMDGSDTSDGSSGATTTGNISLVYADYFTSVTPRPDLTFGLIDNVVVDVPEPGSLILLAMGAAALLGRRR